MARFRVDAGPHEVRLRIEWTGSNRVTVPAGGDDEVLEVRHAGWGAVGGIIDGEGRRLLAAALLENGFAPLPAEWWHWSYGDQQWAAFHGLDESLFPEHLAT